MVMKRLVFCLIINVTLTITGFAQQSYLALPQEVDSFRVIEVDMLDQIYGLTPDNTVWKLSNRTQAIFYQAPFGFSIHSLSLSNIYKLCLFSFEQQEVIILDNQLTELLEISLADLGYWNVSSAAFNHEDRLWILDVDTRRVTELNTQNLESRASFSIRDIGDELYDATLQVNADHIYIRTDRNIYKYTLGGKWVTKIPLDNNYLIGEDDALYYHEESNFYQYQPLLPEDSKVLEFHGKDPMSIKNNSLYHCDDKGCYKFSLENR